MFISQKKVITNKPHKCWGCAKEYPAGTEMECNTSTDMGKIFSVYFCPTCVEFLETIPMVDMPEEWAFGELKEWYGYNEYAVKQEIK